MALVASLAGCHDLGYPIQPIRAWIGLERGSLQSLRQGINCSIYWVLFVFNFEVVTHKFGNLRLAWQGVIEGFVR